MLALWVGLPGVPQLAAQDTLRYQGWGNVGDDLCETRLKGHRQYNNLTTSEQNVWARGNPALGYADRFSGINGGQDSRFRLLRDAFNNNFCRPFRSTRDSCTDVYESNFRTDWGAHIITGAILDSERDTTYRHNYNHTGYHYQASSSLETVATQVGLYDPEPIRNNTRYGLVRVEMWVRSMGETGRDYGLLRYSTEPELPFPEIPDGESVTPNDLGTYWKTARYELQADSANNGDRFDIVPLMDLSRRTLDPNREKLQNMRNWTKVTYLLPAECASNPNLRLCYWWTNDNNGIGHFPALTVDEIYVFGHVFEVNLRNTCIFPGTDAQLNLTIDTVLVDMLRASNDTELIAYLSDERGIFDPGTPLGQIALDDLTPNTDGFLTGTLPIAFPDTLTAQGIGGRRIMVRGPINEQIRGMVPDTLVIAQPEFFSIQPRDTLICAGSDIELNLDPPAFRRADWYRLGEDSILSTMPALRFQNIQPEQRGNYYARVGIRGVNSEICYVYSDTSRLRVETGPDVQLNLPRTNVCEGETLVLTGGMPEGGIYSYSYGNTTLEGDTVIFSERGFGSYRIRYTYHSSHADCPGIAETSINVYNAPRGEIVPPLALLCQDNVMLQVVLDNQEFWRNPSTTQYAWGGSGNAPPLRMVDAPGTYGATATYEYPVGVSCSTELDQVIVGIAPPAALANPQFIPQPEVNEQTVRGAVELYAGTVNILILYLNDVEVGRQEFIPETAGTQPWSFDLPRSLVDQDVLAVKNRIDPDCEGRVTESDLVTTLVEESSEISNGFSPNGDGINDTWQILPNIRIRYPEAKVTVFNRWGDEVFAMEGYDNSWDGDDLPDGTYFFVLDLRDGQGEIKGHLTILR